MAIPASDVEYQRSSPGAVPLTAYNRFHNVRELTDFIPRALWPGIANNTNTTPLDTYIAAALADLNGGRLRVPEGHYLHSSTLSFLGLTAIEVAGGNPTGTFFRPTFATGPVLDFGGATSGMISGINIHGIGVLSATARTSGAAIRIRNATKVCVENFWLGNQAIGIEVGTGTSDTTLGGAGKANVVDPSPSTGLGVLISGGVLTTVRGLLIEGNQAVQGLGGIKVTNAADINLRDCSTTFSRDGLIIEPGAGEVAEQIFMSGNTFDTGAGDGIVFRGVGIIRMVESIGDWTATNADCGVHLCAGPTIQNVSFSGLKSVNNGNEGFLAENCSGYLGLFNSLVSGNSTDLAQHYDGIRITPGVPKFMVNGNRSGASGQFTQAQRYGMRIDLGAYTQYSVVGNDFTENAGAFSAEGTVIHGQVGLNLP